MLSAKIIRNVPNFKDQTVPDCTVLITNFKNPRISINSLGSPGCPNVIFLTLSFSKIVKAFKAHTASDCISCIQIWNKCRISCRRLPQNMFVLKKGFSKWESFWQYYLIILSSHRKNFCCQKYGYLCILSRDASTSAYNCALKFHYDFDTLRFEENIAKSDLRQRQDRFSNSRELTRVSASLRTFASAEAEIFLTSGVPRATRCRSTLPLTSSQSFHWDTVDRCGGRIWYSSYYSWDKTELVVLVVLVDWSI